MSPMFYIGVVALLILGSMYLYSKSKVTKIEGEADFESAIDNLVNVFCRQLGHDSLAVSLQRFDGLMEFFSDWTVDEVGTRISPFSFPTKLFAASFEKHLTEIAEEKPAANRYIRLSDGHKQTLAAWKKARRLMIIADRAWPLFAGFIFGSLISKFLLG